MTRVVSVSQGRHRTGKRSVQPGLRTRLHWELSARLPRAARVMNKHCGHRGTGNTVPAPHQGVSSAPALPRCRCASAIAHRSLSWQGPSLSPGTCSTWAHVTSRTRQAVLRGCTHAQRPPVPTARSQVPQSRWAGAGGGRGSGRGAHWARCNGGAEGDRAERPPHLPCIRLAQTLPLPGTRRRGAALCPAAGLSPALLIRACGHIFSLTIFNPHFASSPFSLFSVPLSRQQQHIICTAACRKAQGLVGRAGAGSWGSTNVLRRGPAGPKLSC